MSVASVHIPVMVDEAIDNLVSNCDGCYLDATYGRGGYSQKIISKLSLLGNLYCADKDAEAIRNAELRFAGQDRVYVAISSFSDLEKSNWRGVSDLQNEVSKSLKELFDGIVIDCGVSTNQLMDATRGFSFMRDGPLDMRMDISQALHAAQFISTVSEEDLCVVLLEYGQEKNYRKIARAIVSARKKKPIKTTLELVEVIKSVNGSHDWKHCATRTFQAIRIVVNNELEEIISMIKYASDWLKPQGKFVAVTFHSLEVRAIRFACRLPDNKLKLIKTIISPKASEVINNPSSRSAQLRVFEKCLKN
ncbi:MAG: 16S rRNA (cytosine(1402)-N(4))-methyltransferase RsmH [Methylacidiphilales bacterium]|nr:16S rRNA (cytosine(1402)-N(4))-methyltransferase RsmH [Candidatus Methylacidiphilales bacterium]